jgi:hypothetical protein
VTNISVTKQENVVKVYHTGVLVQGAVTSHGDLTGLSATDSHPMSAITGLDAALSGKAPNHTHPYASQINVTTLGSNVANSTTTNADVTGLVFPVTAGLKYKFKFYLQYDAAAVGTGARFTINGPAMTSLNYTVDNSAGTGLRSVVYLTTLDSTHTPSAGSHFTTGNVATITGILTPSATGTVIPRFASEVATSAITVKSGSIVEYQIV